MNITQEAQDKAKMLLNRFVFFPSVIVFALLLSEMKIDIFLLMVFYVGAVFYLPYRILRYFILPSITKSQEKKLIKAYHQHQQNNENYQYNKNLNRDLERKRMELEIEFNHLKKIILLNSASDERKMRLIQEMERELKNQQNQDLESLSIQIERMKREL